MFYSKALLTFSVSLLIAMTACQSTASTPQATAVLSTPIQETATNPVFTPIPTVNVPYIAGSMPPMYAVPPVCPDGNYTEDPLSHAFFCPTWEEMNPNVFQTYVVSTVTYMVFFHAAENGNPAYLIVTGSVGDKVIRSKNIPLMQGEITWVALYDEAEIVTAGPIFYSIWDGHPIFDSTLYDALRELNQATPA